MDVTPPPRGQGAEPPPSAVHEVERIVRKASQEEGTPLTLAEISRRMGTKDVRPQVVKSSVKELERRGLVAVGVKGVFWIAACRDVWDRPTDELA